MTDVRKQKTRESRNERGRQKCFPLFFVSIVNLMPHNRRKEKHKDYEYIRR